MTNILNLQDATRVQGDQCMNKTVNLCDLKELCYYQFHMHTAMKTIDMQTGPGLVNTKSNCQWIVHSLK